ncbi:MAG TPA: sterol desaturase family protein [Edaphocola sp.]|nr:sterol desaturase family protein [Edaphocola sp.]
MDTSLREQILLLSQVPLYLIVIGIELFIMNFQIRKLYKVKESIQSIYLSLVCFIIDLAFRVVYLYIFALCAKYSFLHWDNHGWLYWVSLVVLQDFAFYWLHRNDHFIRFFWATHITHHSAVNYNITVGFRSSVLEPLYRFVYFIPIVFLGFSPIDILFVFSATQIWGTLIHTKAIGKLGFLEKIFVTPSHHRVHHASNAKYLDKNMGMFLIFWDKMFGTFQEELSEKEYEPIRYGLTHNPEKLNWFTIIFHEFIAIVQDIRQPGLTFKERLRYVFDRPGYSHDGSRMTSEKMREEEHKQFIMSKEMEPEEELVNA